MTDKAQALLPVTPEDREAAWPFIPANSIAGTNRVGFFDGKYDDCQAVQAFARHRISHSLPGDVGMREALEASHRIIRAMRIHHGTHGGSCGQCGKMWDAEVDEAHHDSCQIVKNAAALTPSALSEADAVTVLADHPLAKGLRTSQKALDEIARQEQANIAGYLALRDFPIGSALSGDAGEGGTTTTTKENDDA